MSTPEETIKIRLSPMGHAAYISAGSKDGIHRGVLKHSGEPIQVRWNDTSREWERTDVPANDGWCRDCDDIVFEGHTRLNPFHKVTWRDVS